MMPEPEAPDQLTERLPIDSGTHEPKAEGMNGGASSRRLVRGTTYSLASLGLASLFLFALHVLIARAFGADVLGAYSIAVGVMSVAVAAGLLGLETGMLKILPPRADQPGGLGLLRPLIGMVLMVVALTTAILGAGLALALPWIIEVFNVAEFQTFFAYVFLALPLLGLNTIGLAIFRSLSWFPTEAAINGLLSRGLRPAVLALLLWAGVGLGDPSRVLLIVIFAAEGLTAIVLLWVLFSRLQRTHAATVRSTSRSLRSALRFSVPVTPAMTIQAGLQHADLIVIGALATVADTGVYRAASLVALTLALIMRAFGAAFAPMISEDYAAGRLHSLRQRYRDVAFLIFSVSLPAFFLFVVNRAGIMSLFGSEFVTSGATVLVILAAGQLVNAATGQVGYMLLLTNSRNAYVWTAFLAVASTVAFTAAGYRFWGLLGAAAGSAAATGGMNVLRAVVLRRRLAVHPFSLQQLTVGAAALILTALAVGLESWLQPPTWLTLLVSLALISPVIMEFSSKVSRFMRSSDQVSW